MSQLSIPQTQGANALALDPFAPVEAKPLAGADAAIFERLPIRPAPPFDAPRLRLVGEPSRTGGRGAGAAVAGLAGGARPARAGARSRVRLTRRGRVVLVVLAAAITSLLLFGLGLVPSPATGSGGAATGGSAPSGPSVVVQPGDSLWSIAVAAAPQADPRVTVQQIIDRNGLSGTAIQAGQVLVLPS